jgi:anti-sigma-K factor RskA
MPRRRDLHQLSGAYALDAIDDEAEAERFARHLRKCQACAGEVRGLREVATVMGFAAEEYEPPASLRADVLDAITRTRQLPPHVAPSRRKRRPMLSWTPQLVAVAAAIAAIVLGIQLAGSQDRLQQAQAISAVLAAPDARVVTGPVMHGGSATVVVSAARRELVVTARRLPPLPSGRVYELWLIGPSRTVSAGLLSRAGGNAVLAGGLAAGDKLGMTVEPSGGSAQPTTTPILVLPLAA